MASEELNAIVSRLEAELAKERQAASRSKMFGGVGVVFVALYLGYISVQLGHLLNPDELALAATGAVIGAVPEASAHIRTLVVDGAPDLARVASDQVLGMIPSYREALQNEINPVIDEVCVVLADRAVGEIVKRGGDPTATLNTDVALDAGAAAAVARLDSILAASLDAPDDEGKTSRQRIEGSLVHLVKIDKDLKLMAAGKGDAQERELLLGVLNLVAQQHDVADEAAKQAYKEGERVPD